jgi:6-phosphogluconolactonase
MRLALAAVLLGGCLGAATTDDGGARGHDLAVSMAVDAGVGDLSRPGGGGDGATTPPPDLLPPPTYYVYVSGYSPQIARFVLNVATGALTAQGTTPATGSPSFLAVDPARRHLYAVDETNSKVEAYAIDAATGALTHVGSDAASGGSGPAHLSVDGSGKWVLVANYGDGATAVLPIASDGSVGAAVTTNKDCSAEAHHFVTDASNQHAFVECLHDNKTLQYTFNAATGALTSNPPLATGEQFPRHLALRPGDAFAYVIEETDSMMDALALDGAGHLTLLQRLSTLPVGSTQTATGAEVQAHPSGRFLYGSNRYTAADGITPTGGSIVAYSLGSDGKLTLLGHTATGKTPRHFSLDPGGRWLLVADQNDNDVRVFAVDATSGMLSAVGTPVSAPSPSFVGVVPLP